MASSAYSFKGDVIVIYGGLTITGLAEGNDVVLVERNADMGTGKVGADGDSIFSQSADQSFTITLKLLPSSNINDFLSEQSITQQNIAVVPLPFLLKNAAARDVFTAPKCFIQKMPATGYGVELSDREWKLWCGEGTFFLGGSN